MGEIMSCSAVLGAQWGDEGKGKIVDMYSEQAECILHHLPIQYDLHCGRPDI